MCDRSNFEEMDQELDEALFALYNKYKEHTVLIIGEDMEDRDVVQNFCAEMDRIYDLLKIEK
jgi:flavodoxin